MKKNVDQRKMAPLKSEPPGMERDSKGRAIPLKERTAEDQAKAKRAKIGKGGATQRLPLRSDAMSGKAGKTPETPPSEGADSADAKNSRPIKNG
jgi:hypothetical protein